MFDGLLEADQFGHVQCQIPIFGVNMLARIAGEESIPDGRAGG